VRVGPAARLIVGGGRAPGNVALRCQRPRTQRVSAAGGAAGHDKFVRRSSRMAFAQENRAAAKWSWGEWMRCSAVGRCCLRVMDQVGCGGEARGARRQSQGQPGAADVRRGKKNGRRTWRFAGRLSRPGASSQLWNPSKTAGALPREHSANRDVFSRDVGKASYAIVGQETSLRRVMSRRLGAGGAALRGGPPLRWPRSQQDQNHDEPVRWIPRGAGGGEATHRR